MNKNIKFHGNLKTNDMIIHWLPTNYCNYNCSYCIAHAPIVNKNISFMDLSILKNCADKIFSINKDKYTFVFSGGEPTIYPYFIDLAEYLSKNKNTHIYLFSNGHKNKDYFSKLFSINNFNFNFSVHLEYANISHIKELIKLANTYNKYIMVSLMMNPDKKEKYELFFDELLEYRKYYYFGIDLAIIHNNEKIDKIYNKDEINWFNNSILKLKNVEEMFKYTSDIPDFFQDINTRYIFEDDKIIYLPHRVSIIENMKNFENYFCVQGINSMSINHNGDYKGSECSISPLIGNIYYDDIDYLKLIKPIKCSINDCNCRINNYSPKFKYQKECYNFTQINTPKIIPSFYLYNEVCNLKNQLNDLNNKMNKIIDSIVWFIPVKKLRDNFRNKFKTAEQSRAEQSRAEQSRAVMFEYAYRKTA